MHISIVCIILSNKLFNDDYNALMMNNGHFGDKDVPVLASICDFDIERENGYWSLVRFLEVLVCAL